MACYHLKHPEVPSFGVHAFTLPKTFRRPSTSQLVRAPETVARSYKHFDMSPLTISYSSCS